MTTKQYTLRANEILSKRIETASEEAGLKVSDIIKIALIKYLDEVEL